METPTGDSNAKEMEQQSSFQAKKSINKPAKNLEILTDDCDDYLLREDSTGATGTYEQLNKDIQASQAVGGSGSGYQANSQDNISNPTWDMFNILSVLGEGAYGKVYKVKCLRSSVISGEANVLTPTMRMRKKLTKNMLGHSMGNSVAN